LSDTNTIRLGFIIPTKDRPQEINRLLKSIYSESWKPEVIIVVDGSVAPIEENLLRDPAVQLIYKRVFPPSLTAQRNAGIQLIPSSLTHVGFLDDDIVILKGSMRALIEGLASDLHNLGGVSFNILEDKPVFSPLAQKALGLFPMKRGHVSLGGSIRPNVNLEKDLDTHFLCGGATVWRADVLSEFSFDESFRGYALWEDVDYSFRVSKKWKLKAIASAKVLHLHVMSSAARSQAAIGDIEIIDRFHFFSKHRQDLSFFVTCWAGVGTVLKNFYLYAKGRHVTKERISANLDALRRCLKGKFDRKQIA
jgi:glycosyltransferase involved in cell wall biosynthesis